jgi:hypothetical protein
MVGIRTATMELTRADFGFGRVVIDDRGVTRRQLFSTRTLAWNTILDYRDPAPHPAAARSLGPDPVHRDRGRHVRPADPDR